MIHELTLPQWQEYVDQHPDSCVFHDRRWIELMVRQYGFKPIIPAIVEGDRIKAAIPFLVTRTIKGKKKLVSLPFSDDVNPLADDDTVLDILVQNIQEKYSRSYSKIETRSQLPGIEESRLHKGYVKHVLELAGDADTLFGNANSQIRRGVRKAEKEGLSVQIHTDEKAMDFFYDFHLETRKFHGLPVQPRGFFKQLHKAFMQTGNGFIALAIYEGRPISAAIFLRHKDTLVYKYGASHRDALNLRPNNILFWEVIKRALDDGFKFLDYGISEKDNEGLRRFKSNWGAIESDVTYTYLSGSVSFGKAGRMSLVHKVITSSPPIVCRIVGELLYRYAG